MNNAGQVPKKLGHASVVLERVYVVAGHHLYNGTKTTEGQSEMSPLLAKQLGLLQWDAAPDCPRFYPTAQFRGVLPTKKEDCLCKGMLLVDPTLEEGIRLRKDCVKVIVESNSSPMRYLFAGLCLADRRATARTTFVEPCSIQTKKRVKVGSKIGKKHWCQSDIIEVR